jgi:hypothetical protein
MQGLLKRDDVLLLNNSRVGDMVDRIYPIELEISNKFRYLPSCFEETVYRTLLGCILPNCN